MFKGHDGLYLINKPTGISSQKYLADFKEQELGLDRSRKGIGHTGILDPFASGLLLVGIGEGLKLLHAFQGLEKTYVARMVFSHHSESYDTETPLILNENYCSKEVDWSKFLKNKIGSFMQKVPKFSAARINGTRAYKIAAKNTNDPSLDKLKEKPREIIQANYISSGIEKEQFEDELKYHKISLEVSSGTYIRALARDWGAELFDCEGFLISLFRKKIGKFQLDANQNFKKLSLSDLEHYYEIIEFDDQEKITALRNGLFYGDQIVAIDSSKQKLLVHSETGNVLAVLDERSQLKRVVNC